MKNSRLYLYLNSLKDKELRSLKKLLRPPSGEEPSYLFKLFEFFLGKLPLKETSRLGKKHVFSKIFSNKAYDAGRLDKLASQLVSCIESFLVQQQLEKDKSLKYQALARSLSHRKDSRCYEAAMKKWESALDGEGDSLFAYFPRFLFSIQCLDHHGTHENKEAHTAVLHDARQRLNELNLAWQLFFELERMARSKYIRSPLPPPRPELLEELVKALEGAEERPMIRLYLKLFQMSSQPGERQYFDEAWKALRASAEQLSSAAALQVLRYLLNHCIDRYSKGAGEFLGLQLELYKWGEEKEAFVEDGMIEDSIFLNAVVTAATAGDFTFAWQFMEKNEARITPARKDAAVRMAKAYIYFHEGKYDKAIEQIDSLLAQDFDFAIRRQSLLLRAAYKLFEQDKADIEDVKDRCRTYREFFERDTYKLAKSRKANYLHLAYYVEEMAAHHYNYRKEPPKPAQELRAELAEKVPAASGWVREELGRLSGAGVSAGRYT